MKQQAKLCRENHHGEYTLMTFLNRFVTDIKTNYFKGAGFQQQVDI